MNKYFLIFITFFFVLVTINKVCAQTNSVKTEKIENNLINNSINSKNINTNTIQQKPVEIIADSLEIKKDLDYQKEFNSKFAPPRKRQVKATTKLNIIEN